MKETTSWTPINLEGQGSATRWWNNRRRNRNLTAGVQKGTIMRQVPYMWVTSLRTSRIWRKRNKITLQHQMTTF